MERETQHNRVLDYKYAPLRRRIVGPVQLEKKTAEYRTRTNPGEGTITRLRVIEKLLENDRVESAQILWDNPSLNKKDINDELEAASFYLHTGHINGQRLPDVTIGEVVSYHIKKIAKNIKRRLI